MKVVSWNIRQGGGWRVEAICDRLGALDADVHVLTEFRENRAGEAIRRYLKNCGHCHQYSGCDDPRINTVFVSTRDDSIRLDEHGLSDDLLNRVVSVAVNGVKVIGVYFPLGRAKVPLFQYLISLLDHELHTPVMIIGDFNTGKHGLDEVGKTFIASTCLDDLERKGWRDLWRSVHGNRRQYSWWSTRGNGFRIDHAFGSRPLAQRIASIDYVDEPRIEGLSDHSLLVVQLDAAGD